MRRRRSRGWGHARSRVLLTLAGRSLTAAEVGEQLGVSDDRARVLLRAMLEMGVVTQEREEISRTGAGRMWRHRFTAVVGMGDVLEERCPNCGEGPGYICSHRKRTRVWPHPERFAAAVACATERGCAHP